MLVHSQPPAELFASAKTCKPATILQTGVPVINLMDPDAKNHIVMACQEYGFFRVVNHGVPLDYMARLEALATDFFSLPQAEKDKAGPPDPFGYGSKNIGRNGDVGWIEYLLLQADPKLISDKTRLALQHNEQSFRRAMEDYLTKVKKMAKDLVELMAEGLGIEPRNIWSKMLEDEQSDSFFRINHYPPCPSYLQTMNGPNLIGFGEHADPQIISVLKSNDTSGLQICLGDGSWATVPPDHTSFFVNVGDAMQVMTNGRFRSVKHRVMADKARSRISMIYFGGPPLNEKIGPLPHVVREGQECRYNEFTWQEYKTSACNSRLADNRLRLFEKTAVAL